MSTARLLCPSPAVALAPMLLPGSLEEDVNRRSSQLLDPLRDELNAEANELARNAPRRRTRNGTR